MLAAGFDLPYVQDQVGHSHPTTTLAIYARVIRRSDRDAMRAEMRTLLGEDMPLMGSPATLAAGFGNGPQLRGQLELGGLER